eukprot:1076746-Rhodomonas_salina.1
MPVALLDLRPGELAGIVLERPTILLAPIRIQLPCRCEKISLNRSLNRGICNAETLAISLRRKESSSR